MYVPRLIDISATQNFSNRYRSYASCRIGSVAINDRIQVVKPDPIKYGYKNNYSYVSFSPGSGGSIPITLLNKSIMLP